MHIVRYKDSIGCIAVGARRGSEITSLAVSSIAELLALRAADMRVVVEANGPIIACASVTVLPPLDGRTEVWASGVTYLRSQQARIEESTQQSVYELVYDAPRPELFFKSVAWRVVTDTEGVAIRLDSRLDVPEPELGLVINSRADIVGYVVCNDMSSRSIEGENPLYLPQAKVYAGACAVSDGIRPAWEVDASNLDITLTVTRANETLYAGSTSTSQLHRSLPDLVRFLYAAENHPDGAFLSTGTGIVPEVTFSLAVNDTVTITIDEVGVLANHVLAGREHFEYLMTR
jgi:2-dehydro-3-deoxy-D-arabinonate dehydratase